MKNVRKRLVFKLICLVFLTAGTTFLTSGVNANANYCEPWWGYQCCNGIPCPEGMHCGGINGCVCDCVDEWGNCVWTGCNY